MSAAPDMSALTTEGGSRCPVCGAPAERRLDLGDFALFACGACGCWSSDALVRGAETSFVPEAYFENSDLERSKWEALEQRLGERPVTNALDVGCGTGAYLTHLRQRFPDSRVAGIELDAGRAEQARAQNPGAVVHTADALEGLAQEPGPFDRITLWDVFEHVPAPTRLLEALAERLAPGGALYIQTINEHSAAPTLGRWSYRASLGRLRFPARRTHEPHHLVFFTRRGLEGSARTAGLRIRELWFDRLQHERMDGSAWLTRLTSAALALENRLGGGLFINLWLERDA